MKSPSEQSNLTEKAFLKTLLLSLFSILFAMVCLVGLTYAWFSAHVSGGVTTMTAARFGVQSVDIAVVDPASGSSQKQGDGCDYLLTATENGAKFAVTCTAGGEATQGYFSIKFSAQGGESSFSFASEYLSPEGEFSFTVTFDGAPMSEGGAQLSLSIRAAWGNIPAEAEQLITGSGVTFDGEQVTIAAP